MKVHPLFQSPSDPSTEDMLRMLDLSDDAPEKRAFLAHCNQSEALQAKWRDLNAVIGKGKQLPQSEPRLSIRENVLNAAATNQTVVQTPQFEPVRPDWKLNGWRWAWAAIFLVVMWGGSAEFQRKTEFTWNTETSWEAQSIEEELLTLDEEMAELFSDFESDFESAFSGLTS